MTNLDDLGGSIDSGVATDAKGADVAPVGDGGTTADADGGLCGAAHSFCDDFDTTSTFPGKWDAIKQDIGYVSIDPNDAVSSPHSMYVGKSGGSTTGESDLLKVLPLGRNLTMTFSIKLSNTSVSSYETEFVAIDLQPPPTGSSAYRIGLIATPPYGYPAVRVRSQPADGGAAVEQVGAMGIPDTYLATWAKLTFTIDIGNGLTRISEGTYTGQETVPYVPPTTKEQFILRVGIVSSTDSAAVWGMHLDNVVVDVQ